MTTIAWTPGVLAADSCLTIEDDDGNAKARTYERKLRFVRFRERKFQHDSVIAVASQGDAAVGNQLDDHLLRNSEQLLKAKNFAGYLDVALNKAALLKQRATLIGDSQVEALLVLFRHGGAHCDIAFQVDEKGFVTRVPETPFCYAAIGCDAPVALGAMHMGANAKKAVEAAVMHGAYTGGPVHYITYDGNGNVLA